MAKKRLKGKMLVAAVVLVLVLGAGFLLGSSLGLFDREIPDDPIRVINESGQQFQVLGLTWDHHLLLHRATDEEVRQAVFPGKLLEGVESLRVVGITRDHKVYVSESEAAKGKKQFVLQAAQPVTGDSMPLLSQLPSLEAWDTAREEGKVSAIFQADTGLVYRVFVLGRGNRLAPSDWETGNAAASVSWEESRGITQSWLLLKEPSGRQ